VLGLPCPLVLDLTILVAVVIEVRSIVLFWRRTNVRAPGSIFAIAMRAAGRRLRGVRWLGWPFGF